VTVAKNRLMWGACETGLLIFAVRVGRAGLIPKEVQVVDN